MSMFKLLFHYLPDADEASECGEWCFGPAWNDYQYPEIMVNWDALHASIQEIKDHDSFLQYIPKMIDMWRAFQPESNGDEDE